MLYLQMHIDFLWSSVAKGSTCSSAAADNEALINRIEGDDCACRSVFVKASTNSEMIGRERAAEQHNTCYGSFINEDRSYIGRNEGGIEVTVKCVQDSIGSRGCNHTLPLHDFLNIYKLLCNVGRVL